jgi:hypothetical protein|tara:strand:- start:46 stop:390 length:345 start_codon:yes stop_codon:yes gene_type:complete
MSDNSKIKLLSANPDGWDFKVKEGNRRMKLYVKLNKAETQQWSSLKESVKPPGMGDDEFAKILFFRGVNGFMEELTTKINSMTDEEREAIMVEGEAPPTATEVITEGSVSETDN